MADQPNLTAEQKAKAAAALIITEVPPKNHMRRSTVIWWCISSLFTGCGTFGTYYGVRTWQENKPFYDTFQTKKEAEEAEARSQAIIGDLKDLAKNYQKLTIENTTALNSLSSKLDERHKDAQAVHKYLTEDVAKNKLDIANIKFILKIKNN